MPQLLHLQLFSLEDTRKSQGHKGSGLNPQGCPGQPAHIFSHKEGEVRSGPGLEPGSLEIALSDSYRVSSSSCHPPQSSWSLVRVIPPQNEGCGGGGGPGCRVPQPQMPSLTRELFLLIHT